MSSFHPYQALAETLLLTVQSSTQDGAHDQAHLLRVWKNIKQIQAVEGGELRLLLAACILHDCVNVPKDSALRSKASLLSAEQARKVLLTLDWSEHDIEQVTHAIAAHSYSAKLPANTLEAKILQDADRLDAIGAMGIARCFYTAGRMGSQLYDPQDPQAAARPLNDQHYALDHFQAKLFTLADHFQTNQGQRMAKQRHEYMQLFVATLAQEI